MGWGKTIRVWKVLVYKLKVKVTQLCPALCDPMDCTLHGILQARILEWAAFPFAMTCLSPGLQAFPWTARRSNQSVLKEICPEYSLEGLMLKLKLQSFGHLMGRTHSLKKTLKLGKIEGRRRRERQRLRWLDGITDWWTWVWVSSGS